MVRAGHGPKEPVPRHARPDRERGAVAVEFALVFPLLFVMLFGTLIFGWRIWEHQAGQSTARLAARDAALGIGDTAAFARNVVCFGEKNGLVEGGVTRVEVGYYDAGMNPVPGATVGGYVQVGVTSRSRLGSVPMISDDDGTFTSSGLDRIEQVGSVVAPATIDTTGVTCA